MMKNYCQRKKEDSFVVGRYSGDTKYSGGRNNKQQDMTRDAGNHADTYNGEIK